MRRKTWGHVKTGALAGVVATVALVPLYGDPRNTAVTHAEWARMLLRGLELDRSLPSGAQASLVFSTLSWKNSLAYRADHYAWGDGVRVEDEGEVRRVMATAEAGEVTYPISVVRGGNYKVRLRTQGNPAAP